MKKFYTLLTLCFAFLTLSAQIQKGDFSLNGRLSANHIWSESDIDNGFYFGHGVSFGYLVSDNWMLGLDIRESIDFEGISPQVRYYFNPESEKNIYFVDALGRYDFSENETSAAFSVGLNRFIGDNLALEASGGLLMRNDVSNIVRVGLGLRSFISSDDWRGRKEAVSRFRKGSYLIGIADLELEFLEDVFQFGFNVSGGYFLTDRIAVGLRNSTGISRRQGFDLLDFRFLSSEFATFGRYYLQTSGKCLVPFTELAVGFSNSRLKSIDNYEFNSSRWFTEARFGANLFITPELAFEFALVGRQESRTDLQSDYLDRVQFPEEQYRDFDGSIQDRSFDLGLHVGLQFFLRQE